MISIQEGEGSKPVKQDDQVLQLKMVVAGCRPLIWRRVLVRESMWLSRLHDMIQLIFDWYDYQTHAFTIGDQRLGNPLKRDEFMIADDRDVTLGDLGFAAKGHVIYGYHFGEGWQVDVVVEKVLPPTKGKYYPSVLEGERAGPPEDCGGLEAYHDMLACIQEPHTELGREWLEWLGPEYDSERCDIVAINKALKKLGK